MQREGDMDIKIVYAAITFGVIVVLALVYLTACTYSITQVHTQGTASDVVDETASNTPSTSVSPTFSLPAAAIL